MQASCPKCQSTLDDTLSECPACGVILARVRRAAPGPSPGLAAAAEAIAASPSAPTRPAPRPARRGITETSGGTFCVVAAVLLILQVLGFVLSLFLSALAGLYPVRVATPAIGATILLLVLGRILVELERIRAVAEDRAQLSAPWLP